MNYTEQRALFEKRSKLLAESRAILDAAPAEGMSVEDEQRFDKLHAEIDELDKKLPSAQQLARLAAIKPEGNGAPFRADDASMMFRTMDGQQIRGLRPTESMSAMDPYRNALNVGAYMRGILTGDWRQADTEMRAASEGTLGSGGYLLPAPIAGYIIDKARNSAVLMKSGAVTIPMPNSSFAIARVTGDVAVGWMAENAAQTSADAAFNRVTFNAHTLSALTTASVELAEDTNFADIIAAQLAKVLALELDRAGLEGDGSGASPTGVFSQSGVTLDTTMFGANGSTITTTTPAGFVAWDFLGKAIANVRALNEVPTSVVMHERTLGELDALRATTGIYLPPPPSVQNLENGILSTNALSITRTRGANSDCSNVYVYDGSKLLVGVRNALVLEVSREASDASSDAFASRQIKIRAYMRADIQLARPAAFYVVEGAR